MTVGKITSGSSIFVEQQALPSGVPYNVHNLNRGRAITTGSTVDLTLNSTLTLTSQMLMVTFGADTKILNSCVVANFMKIRLYSF